MLQIIDKESFLIKVQKYAAIIFYANYKDFQHKGMVFDINNVDDLVQQTYKNVCQAIDNNHDLEGFNEKQAFEYFKKTLESVLKSCIRKKLAIKNNATIMQMHDEDFTFLNNEASYHITRESEQKLNAVLALDAIESMKDNNPRCHKILKYKLKDLTDFEIAEELDIRYENIKVYLSRCRKLLVQKVAEINKTIQLQEKQINILS